MNTTTDYTTSLKTMVADMQTKAKDAYTKGSSAMGEASAFTKGNVEAMVESSKIMAYGIKDMSTGYVAESKAAVETMTADIKELAKVTSPTELMKLQGAMMRRNFDTAVASSSKYSEAMLKLVNEAFAPISGRVSLAVEKVKLAA